MGVLTLVLVGVGVLLGSFWLEWRHTRLDAGPAPETLDRRPVTPGIDALDERISVEVLNGAGDRGAAEEVAKRLRRMGFDVKTYGNAKSFDQVRTRILDRSGRTNAATVVSDSLGGVEIVVEPKPELYLDATLVLGKDWPRLLNRPR